MEPLKFVNHSYWVQKTAKASGWLPGARYTNLRDVRRFDRLGFLDIDWENYNFERHLSVVRSTRPVVTVAQDIVDIKHLARILDQAHQLAEYSEHVVVVPKDARLESRLEQLIPKHFLLGYSVPTRYGATKLPPAIFKRPVHLLGGRPDIQRRLASVLNVFSLDCNRFTFDARFGDYFDGSGFRPHPAGGYKRCISDSIANIDKLWSGYTAPKNGFPRLSR